MVKNFTSHYGLGPEAAERMRDAERMLTSAGEKIDILVKKFEKEFKKLHGEIKSNQGIALRTNDFERPSLQQFLKNEDKKF